MICFDWHTYTEKQGQPGNPRYRGCIGSVKSDGLYGVYENGVLYTIDRNALRSAVPHQWRKMIDRAQLWWRTGNAWSTTHGGSAATLDLYDYRDRYVDTIVLTPFGSA